MTEVAQTPAEAGHSTVRQTLASWPLFIVIGLMLYGLLYFWSETLVYRHADHNRFFAVATAPLETYDYVILGASHALPLGYADFNTRLEEASGASVINLANEGAGILPNQLILDYFLADHAAHNVIFFLDSFAFYSPQWNEERLDSGLLARAPFDPTLVASLWQFPWARDEILPYATGFTKINNQDRSAPDKTDAELTKFNTTYRPVPQIDKQRVTYLYPDVIPEEIFARYLAEFEAMIETVEAQGGNFIVVKPPTPVRYREALPGENQFDAAIAKIVERRGIAYHNFSEVLPGDENYYDTDHLNATGVAAFIEQHFAELLRD